jgi:hypothetical protein
MAEDRPRTWMEDRHVCWKCGEAYPEEVLICVKCGIDLRSGDEIKTYEDSEEPLTPLQKGAAFIGSLMPGLFRPILAMVSVAVMAIGLFVMALSVGMSGLVPLSSISIGAAGLIVYAHGISWLLGGECGFLSSTLAELDARRWVLFFVILWAPIVAVLATVKFATG